MPRKPPTYALILAAGASTRMGRSKADLPWLNGTTLLTYQIEQWRAVNVVPIAVLNPTDSARSLNCQTVSNSNPERGKTSSVLVGLQAIPEAWDAVAIAAVDQPRPAHLYAMLLNAFQHHPAPITAPTYRNRLGHPLVFGWEARSHLFAVQEATFGLRQVVKTFANRLQRVEYPDELIHADLNTPEVYQNWCFRLSHS